MAVVIWQDNTSPSLTDTITVNGAAFDLTGSTVNLRMQLASAPPGGALKIDAAATVVNAPGVDGKVRYDWAAGDVDTAGEYVAWWHVTLPSTKVQDSDEFEIEVRPHGLQSGNLCTLTDVREALELPASETNRDELILSLIPVASQMLMDHCEREFAPSPVGITRRFKIDARAADSGVVDFYPYDLQTATLVSLHPEQPAPITLTAGIDYALSPAQNSDGVYTSLRLSQFLSIISPTLILFNYALVDITGTWGFPAVPVKVNQAAVDAVCAWLRRDVSTLGLQLQDGMQLSPATTASFDLPLSSIRKVNSYRRNVGAF